ncbi:MAG: HNH endonuclease [Anaerolineae bacterium]
MKRQSLQKRLKPYSAYNSRMTTIWYAFASALAPSSKYVDEVICLALETLGQNPDQDLVCVYCDQPATTWDHLQSVVKNKRFSGYGHTLGNLVPCCRECNSRKSGKNWRNYLEIICSDAQVREIKAQQIQSYIDNFLPHITSPEEMLARFPEEMAELDAMLIEIGKLVKSADELALKVRKRLITEEAVDKE